MASRGRESSRPPTIVTAATEKEARRVLQWQEEVARSTAGSSTSPTSDEAYRAVAPSHVSRAPARTQVSHAPQSQAPEHPPFRRAETFPRVMRRETYAGHGHPGTQVSIRRDMSHDEEQTVYVDEVERAEQEKEKEKNGGLFGMTNKALVGTFLGAAAGAAFAYAMVKSEDPEYELEPERKSMPGLRRSYTTGHAETIASSTKGSNSGGPERRYRVIEAPHAPMPPPASSYSRIQRDREREREGVLSPIEERSYYSSGAPSNTGTKIRPRHTADQAKDRMPEPQDRPPRSTSEIKPKASRPPNQVSVRESEYEYGPAPTQVSAAPARYSQAPRGDDAKSANSRAPSHLGVSERERERIPRSEATWERDDVSVSAVSERSRARDVPLPASTVVSARYGGGYREQGSGYTHAGDRERDAERRGERDGNDRKSCFDRGVDEDGKSYFNPRGAMSVAPSDSVSSVGSKRERIERLRGRMERDLRV
ncbi:hypothetical protein H4I95_03691 [Botrytis cinerea]